MIIAVNLEKNNVHEDLSTNYVTWLAQRQYDSPMYYTDNNGRLCPLQEVDESKLDSMDSTVFVKMDTKDVLSDIDKEDILKYVLSTNLVYDVIENASEYDLKDGVNYRSDKRFQLVDTQYNHILDKSYDSEQLKRALCDILGVGYYRSKEDIINLIKKDLCMCI